MSITVNEALEFATKAHAGQKRWDRSPYINHPIEVSGMVHGNTNKIIALLHDTVEDCNITDDDLRQAGLTDVQIDMIDCLTKRQGESYLDYLCRVVKYDTTIDVKVADLKHNSFDLRPGNMRDKYSLALFLLTNKEGIDALKNRASKINSARYRD